MTLTEIWLSIAAVTLLIYAISVTVDNWRKMHEIDKLQKTLNDNNDIMSSWLKDLDWDIRFIESHMADIANACDKIAKTNISDNEKD